MFFFHVIDHDVVVSHGDGVGLGSDELRGCRRGGEPVPTSSSKPEVTPSRIMNVKE